VYREIVLVVAPSVPVNTIAELVASVELPFVCFVKLLLAPAKPGDLPID